jgi:hypothetical protein
MGTDASAFGYSAWAGGVRGTAIGTQAVSGGRDSTALGSYATAQYDESTAIGTGATTWRANQVMIGTQNNNYAMPGLAPGGNYVGKAYQNPGINGTRVITTDAQGNLGTSFDPDALQNSISQLGAGIAAQSSMAAALSAVPTYVAAEDEFGRCGVGAGGTSGQGAAALGCAIKLGDRVHLNGAIAIGPSTDYGYGTLSGTTGRIGITFPLGTIQKKKTPAAVDDQAIAALVSQRDAQIDQLNKQINQLQSQIQQLTTKAKGEAPNAQTDQQVKALQTQLTALQAKLADSQQLTTANAELSARVKELESQIKALQKAAASPAISASEQKTIQTLEDRLNKQDSLIQKLMDKLQTMSPLKGKPPEAVAPTAAPATSSSAPQIKPIFMATSVQSDQSQSSPPSQ